MKRNSRFSLALHALGHMAADPTRPRTSAEIAAYNGTHPAFARRVLGLLREGGILTSHKGHAGGWALARPPGEITMADVYAVLSEGFLRPAAKEVGDTVTCNVERILLTEVDTALDRAEATLIEELERTTIAALAARRTETSS